MQAHALTMKSPFIEAEAKFEEMLSRYRSKEAADMTHREMERELEEQGQEPMRLVLQGSESFGFNGHEDSEA